MSARKCISESEEEEEMVRRVGGRGRGVVQAVLKMRRERAGRASQNFNLGQRTPTWTGQVVQEVGPHGHEVERRLGGLQTSGRRNGVVDSGPRTGITEDIGQQTVPEET